MLVAIIGTRDSLDQLRAVNRLGRIRIARTPLPDPTRNDSFAVVGIFPRATRHVPIPLRSEPRLTAYAGTAHLSLRLRIVREWDHIGQHPTLNLAHILRRARDDLTAQQAHRDSRHLTSPVALPLAAQNLSGFGIRTTRRRDSGGYRAENACIRARWRGHRQTAPPQSEFRHYLGPAIRRDLHERIHDPMPSSRYRVALMAMWLRWLIDLESKPHGNVRRERLHTSTPGSAPHAGSARHLADPGRQRFDQPPRSVAELAVLVEVYP